ncbi:MAG TPA: hypothetical protein VGH98_20175 [Gemmatimonadaceae bacterium]|jgi:hypothetical protein
MHSIDKRHLPLIFFIVLAGCSGDTQMTAARLAPTRANADFTNNFVDHSPIIVRVAGIEVRVITVDADQGILAIHGPVDNLPVCTDASTRDAVDGQAVHTPSVAQGSRLLLKAADTHVAIYAGTDISALFPFDPSKFCPFIQNTPTLYEGIVKYSVNLGSASTSFRWEGDVTRSSDGLVFHYVEDQHTVAPGGVGGGASRGTIKIQGMGQ